MNIFGQLEKYFFLLYFVTLVRGVLTDNSRSIPLDSQKINSYIYFLFSISPIEEMAIRDAEHDEQEDEEEEECPRGEVHDGGGEADGDAAQVRHHALLQLPGWTVISCELRAVTFCGSSAAVHLKWVWNRKFENILKEEQSRFHSGNKNYLFNSFFLPLEQRRIKSNVLLSPSKKREKSLEGLFCWYGRCLWLGPVQPQTLDRWVSAVSGYLSNAELIFSSNDPQHISKCRYLLLKAKREGPLE